MTECTQVSFEYEAHFSRRVVAGFDGGTITSDAGALLLRQVDRRIGLLPRLARCFSDFRNPVLVSHAVAEMVSHPVYALALGYEDLNDHDQLRADPLMGLLAGKRKPGAALAMPLGDIGARKSKASNLSFGGKRDPARGAFGTANVAFQMQPLHLGSVDSY
jgi:hypothetical protein